jgi:cytochrome c553
MPDNIKPLTSVFIALLKSKRGWGFLTINLAQLALYALISSYSAQANDQLAEKVGPGRADSGKELSDSERCQECHGSDGISHDLNVPNHAGQNAGYLIKQLKDFQSGDRIHDTMNRMAEDLSETDRVDIAAYFAGQPVMQGTGSTSKSYARNLFENGNPDRQLKPCTQCHGPNGKGMLHDGMEVPVIGGQKSAYLQRQLTNWKSGERQNSPDGLMNKIAHLLTDQEIEDLADYISGL